MVPYKRHASESIEAAVTGDENLSVAADESTINRWRNWFTERAGYLLGCLTSIAARYGMRFVATPPHGPESALQGILVLCRGCPRLVSQNRPPDSKFEFMAAYPFCVLSVMDEV